jgi:hypothetical protein
VVIAIWSKASVAAPWVKEEATVGKNRGVLVPAKIDEVDPPLGFMMIQAADLVDWDGDRGDPRWAYFLDALRHTMHGGAVRSASAAPSDAPVRKAHKGLPLLPIAGGAAVAVVLAVGAWMFLGRASAPVPSSAGAPPPTQQSQTPQQATAGEQRLWDKALEEKSRQAFQTYLVSYPSGAYANRARDALLTCRTETKEVWKAGPDLANQMVRGVASGTQPGGPTQDQLCSKAKDDVRGRAKLMCETIVTNGGYRNAQWIVGDAPCDCQRPNNVVVNCIADLAYSCRWEMKVTERTEICGGG